LRYFIEVKEGSRIPLPLHPFLCLILFGLLLTPPTAVSGADSPDLEPRYEITARLDKGRSRLDGTEEVTLKNPLEQAVDRLVFTLRANLWKEKNPYLSGTILDDRYPNGFNPGWTEIHSVRNAEGDKLRFELQELPPVTQTYSLQNTLLVVYPGEPLKPGQSLKVRITFSTRFPHKRTGDEERYRGIYFWRFGWHPTLAPASWWLDYDEERYEEIKFLSSSFDVRLRLPPEWKAAGKKVEESTAVELAGGESYREHHLSLQEARSFPLLFSSRYETYRTSGADVPVEVLYLPGYENRARVLASWAVEILNYYSARFGPYEGKKMTIAQSPVAGQFGVAADGLTVMGGSFFTESDLLLSSLLDRLTVYLLAHELGHQWFGIGVGADINAQNWISEAFAEFLALRYFHHRYGEEGGNLFRFERDGLFRNFVESQLGYVNLRKHTFELPYTINFNQGFDEGVIKPLDQVQYANANTVRVYKKGYLALRNVEGVLGEERMNKFIGRVFKNYKDRIVDVKQLKDIAVGMTEERKEEVAQFFQEWLFTDGYLDYGVADLKTEKMEGEDRYLNRIKIFRRGSLKAPVELRLTGTEGQTASRVIELQNQRKEIEWNTRFPVEQVALDPGEFVMDHDRINNYYPRKVKFAVGENVLPLDSYLIRINPTSVSGSVPYGHSWQLGTGFVQGSLKLNKYWSLGGMVELSGGLLEEEKPKVEGTLSVARNIWSEPEVGIPGDYWYSRGSAGLLFRREVEEEKGYNYGGLNWNFTSGPGANRSLKGELIGSPKGVTRLNLKTEETTRLASDLYLDLELSLGLSGGELPPFLKFELDELRSYGSWEEDSFAGAKWVPSTFPGDGKLYTRLGLRFPLSRDGHFFLGNLALIKGLWSSFWVAAGDSWNSWRGLNLEDYKWESGVELQVSGSTLGGLIPLQVTLGYAYHGVDRGHGYLELGIGF